MIIVGGATATGKSAFAEYIAESIGGELVSADSMQIYRGMDIGTAKDLDPSVPLHMTDIVSPKDNFTVVDYRDRAVKVISDIAARGGEAVVVGGTGLYIDSLLYDMAYGGSGERDESLMDSLKNELEEKGAKHMHDKLKALDPESADKIHFNNTVRVLRAIYVYMTTGNKISSQRSGFKPAERVKTVILTEERPVLRQRISARVDAMLEAGLRDEVAALLDDGVTFDMQSMQGIGYKEWKPYFESGADISFVRENIIKNTNAYAKRQETWFNNRYKSFAEYIPCRDIKEDICAVFQRVAALEYKQ